MTRYIADPAEYLRWLSQERHEGRVLLRAERDGSSIRVETCTPEELAEARDAAKEKRT